MRREMSGDTLIELVAKQVARPGKSLCSGCAKELDNWLGHVGQTNACALIAEMGGHSPEGLLADEPDTVGDGIQEAALPFKTFGQNEADELVAAAEALRLVAGAVAVPLEIKKGRSEEGAPSGLLVGLGTLKQRGANVGRNSQPGGTIGPARIGTPLICGLQMRGEECLRIRRGEQISRRRGRKSRWLSGNESMEGATQAGIWEGLLGSHDHASRKKIPAVHRGVLEAGGMYPARAR
jgi:hypothetical protein